MDRTGQFPQQGIPCHPPGRFVVFAFATGMAMSGCMRLPERKDRFEYDADCSFVSGLRCRACPLMESADPRLISPCLRSSFRLGGSRSDLFAISRNSPPPVLLRVPVVAAPRLAADEAAVDTARSWANKAQIVRAVLLAIATATTFAGRRSANRNSSNRGSAGCGGTCPRAWIPRRTRPPVPLAARPSQAANSRPDLRPDLHRGHHGRRAQHPDAGDIFRLAACCDATA